MLRKAHLNLIAKHSLKHGIRGGAGLVSIALTLLIGLFLAQCAVGPLERVDKSVDYALVYNAVRQIVESTSFRLLEALAEAISHELLTDFDVTEVGIRLRKPDVELGGPLDYAGIEIWRRRQGG